MTDKAYFQLLDSPMPANEAAGRLYCMPGDETVSRFNQVNGLGGSEMLYPGHFLVTPSLDGVTSHGAAGMQSLSRQVNYFQRNSTAAADPRAFNRDFDLLSAVSANREEIKAAGDYFGGVSDYLGTRLKLITRDFKELERVYDYALSHRIKLGSAQFRLARQPIENALRDQLRGMHKSTILRYANKPSLKDALGISHKSVAHSFRTSGNPVQIKQISQAIDRASNLARKLKHLGSFGTILTMSATVPAIVEDFKQGGAAAGAHRMGHEAAGVAGMLTAAELGASGTTAALLMFGVGTGGVGFIVIGIAAVAGGLLAGVAGEAAGKWSYDKVEHFTNKMTESAVDYIMREN